MNLTNYFFSGQFSSYELRPATEKDREEIATWIAADPDHRDLVKPEFFYQSEPGAECYRLDDSKGHVFYFKMTRALRVDIQFGPASSTEERERNRQALTDGFAWLLALANKSTIREVIFDSTVGFLRGFCHKHFGFRQSPNEMKCIIPSSEASNSAKKLRA